ncbi:MBL fold metallo-hydrolase [Parabacteroides sp. OttesenSCG-928-G07]|nr:MBL fold metallo-hydrolase [Parabacteroides sp. OttesenSCG-928-G21]MDL2277420.1 MBL fold metallo-hydrolase [Parabacteroides sp. OttesenSCG-928-G07]
MKKMSVLRDKSLVLFTILIVMITGCSQPESGFLPEWKEGILDIHQIATGRGNAAFLMLPDGTTMLIDAGDLGDRVQLPQEIMPELPNGSKLPGEWIADYIRHFSAPLKNNGALDYVQLTHYHTDHIGGVASNAKTIAGRNYLLSGIAEVAEYVAIDKIIDRNWPAFDYPSRARVEQATSTLENLQEFYAYQQGRGTKIERFVPGSNQQFVLKKNPARYNNFTIRNIYSSGMIWTGEGEGSRSLFPPVEVFEESGRYPSENMCSSVIKLSYGKFDYFSGGDITGTTGRDNIVWSDVETPVARLVGPVEVALLNHHGYSDAINENFISLTRPQAFIIPVWDFYHPQPEILSRMVDKQYYPNNRYIFATGFVSGNKERLGELGDNIHQPCGHIVTRVYPGGDKYQIFVLDAGSTDYKIIYSSPILEAN